MLQFQIYLLKIITLKPPGEVTHEIMSTEYIVTGLVEYVDKEEKQITPSFTERICVIQTEEQYPQFISVKFTQGKANKELDMITVGSRVTASINLRGRKWVNPQNETKYFNDIQGWKLSIDTGTIHVPATPAAPTQKFVFTATDGTEAAYRTAGWSTEQMIEHKKGHYAVVTPPTTATSAATPPPPAIQSPGFIDEPADDLPF